MWQKLQIISASPIELKKKYTLCWNVFRSRLALKFDAINWLVFLVAYIRISIYCGLFVCIIKIQITQLSTDDEKMRRISTKTASFRMKRCIYDKSHTCLLLKHVEISTHLANIFAIRSILFTLEFIFRMETTDLVIVTAYHAHSI